MSRRASFTQKFKIHGAQGVTVGYLQCIENEDHTLRAINLEIHREGSMGSAMAHSFCTAMNIGLKQGVPLENYVQEFKGWRFDPMGPVEGSPVVSSCTSLLDYVAQELEAVYVKERT